MAELATAPAAPSAGARDATRKQLRGSSLLLSGRLISMGLNFVAQVLVVRYLSTRDYGAFAYALAGVAFFDGISSLGLKRGIARFAPIYHERRDYDRLFGVIALVVATTLLISTLAIGTLYAVPQLLHRLVQDDALAVPLLLIVIFLVPLEALDEMLVALFASFTRPKAIFFRKYVLTPGLKLLAIALLIGFGTSVSFLAYAYVVTSLLGVLLYAWLLTRLLRQQGVLQHFHPRSMRYPVREVFAFTLPLLTSDLVNTVMATASTFFLGYFHDTTQVAFYRVVLPTARLNTLVMTSFQLLYMPQAARLFARGDHAGINTLYWRTAVWMAVLSFPIFALTFSVAHPLTVALYGKRYESSWVLLQMLSFSYYFNVATGFNGLTLKVLGKLRYIVTINVACMAFSVLLDVLLIPRFGALGAAIATLIAMVAYNILKQVGLRLGAGLRIFDWHYLSFYLMLAAGAVGLGLLQLVALRSIWVAVPAAAAVSLAVVWFSKQKLHVEETFPELLRLPLVGRFLRTAAAPAALAVVAAADAAALAAPPGAGTNGAPAAEDESFPEEPL
jgi:O-antigen/teichoic acid export membrane protein